MGIKIAIGIAVVVVAIILLGGLLLEIYDFIKKLVKGTKEFVDESKEQTKEIKRQIEDGKEKLFGEKSIFKKENREGKNLTTLIWNKLIVSGVISKENGNISIIVLGITLGLLIWFYFGTTWLFNYYGGTTHGEAMRGIVQSYGILGLLIIAVFVVGILGLVGFLTYWNAKLWMKKFLKKALDEFVEAFNKAFEYRREQIEAAELLGGGESKVVVTRSYYTYKNSFGQYKTGYTEDRDEYGNEGPKWVLGFILILLWGFFKVSICLVIAIGIPFFSPALSLWTAFNIYQYLYFLPFVIQMIVAGVVIVLFILGFIIYPILCFANGDVVILDNDVVGVDRRKDKLLEEETIAINLADYVKFTAEGYDGYGTVICSMDKAKFMQEHRNRLKKMNVKVIIKNKTSEGTTYVYSIGNYNAPKGKGILTMEAPNFEMVIESLLSCFEKSTRGNDWCNGEKWTYLIDEISRVEALLGMKVDYSDAEYVVMDLTELKEIDPLAAVHLTYANYTNGQAKVVLKGTAEAVTDDEENLVVDVVVEEPEKQGSLSNGDKLLVKITSDFDEDSFARKQGMKLARKEVEVEVYGLNAYGQPGAFNGEKGIVHLKNYVVFRSVGYEKAASIYMNINCQKLIRDYRTSLSQNVAQEEMLGEKSVISAIENLLFNYTLYSYDVTSHKCCEGRNQMEYYDLNNGDTVNIAWKDVDANVLAHLQKLMNIEFVVEDFQFTICGLKEIQTVDAFAEGNVVFLGSNNTGYVSKMITSVDVGGKQRLHEIQVETENNHKLRNGEIIIIHIPTTEQVELIHKWGYELMFTEKEVVVSGLEE